MIIKNDYSVTLDSIDIYNYDLTKNAIEELFSKYRAFRKKEEIITKRLKSSLSLDNLGIFSNNISDPTGNKVEQLQKYNDFTDLIDKTYNTFKNELSEDEKIIYKKTLINNFSDSEVMSMLCLSSSRSYLNRKKSCYIKVARWFDLEVYKDI